jgi:hypothetical protein
MEKIWRWPQEQRKLVHARFPSQQTSTHRAKHEKGRGDHSPRPVDMDSLTRSQGLASMIMLKGVSAARRMRLKPAFSSTFRRRASPAWAPSAMPTS